MFKIDKFLVSSTELFISAFFMYGISLSFVKQMNKKITKLVLHISVFLGIFAGLIKFLVRLSNSKKYNITLIKINRYLIITIAVLVFLSAFFCLLRLLIKKMNNPKYNNIIAIFISLSLFFVFFYISNLGFRMTSDFVYFGEDALSTMALLRAIGFIIGLFVCITVANSIVNISKYLSESKLLLFLFLSEFSFFVAYGTKAVSAMMKLKWIAFSDLIFSIMIFGDSHAKTLIYVLLFVGVLMLAYVFFSNIKIKGEFKNNALRRKARAIARSARRYSFTLFMCILSSVFVLTVVHYYATKPPELAAPQAYEIKENKIIVKFEDINDGHLHRFSYITPKGYNLRFIAVKKTTGEAYGLGLDACEICGIAGYYERGDEVICKMCDVVMNKNTIGFKGGCNPIPFPYEVEKNMIIIDIDDLLREEDRFKE